MPSHMPSHEPAQLPSWFSMSQLPEHSPMQMPSHEPPASSSQSPMHVPTHSHPSTVQSMVSPELELPPELEPLVDSDPSDALVVGIWPVIESVADPDVDAIVVSPLDVAVLVAPPLPPPSSGASSPAQPMMSRTSEIEPRACIASFYRERDNPGSASRQHV
jgi:hypothetical protein